MRWQFQRERSFGGARLRGIGITYHGGCLGTTYGEAGENMFAEISLWVWRGYSVRVSWKRLPRPARKDDDQ